MMTKMKYIARTLLFLLLLIFTSCVSDLLPEKYENTDRDAVRISFVCEDVQHFQVGTRSAVDKTSEETKINKLCIFFFKEDGNFVGLTDAGIASNVFNNGKAYIEGNQTLITLMSEYFADGADKVNIYVVANLDNTFDPSTITKLADLLNYNYAPQSENNRAIYNLPSDGMPMFGYTEQPVDLTQNDQELTVKIKALMAKVEFSIGINSENTDASKTYPRMFIQKWTFGNKSNGVVLGGTETTIFGTGITKTNLEVQKTVEIQQSGSRHTETFYMFENKQTAKTLSGDLSFADEANFSGRERYKPLRANEHAAYIKVEGIFHDASRAQSAAELTFYLGANNYNDFNVKRNCHYNNIVTITGLMSNSKEHEVTHVLYDSRVNVTGTEATPYFLSVLREHDQDAHYGVTPIDFYFYDYEDIIDQQLVVEVVNPTTTNWIRMEKVEAAHMENGTLPSDWMNTHIDAGDNSWQAGHGKRKYFLTNLVTSVLANSSSCTVTGHRDRVYLYIDENLSTKNRTGIVKVTYQIKRTESSAWEVSGDVREIEINQRGLLPVTIERDGKTQTIYIEQIEEYLDNYDPYDMYNSAQIYPGLPWGAYGVSIDPDFSRWNDEYYSDWPNVYLNGLAATIAIVNNSSVNGLIRDLNGVPGTAAEYCYNKNKRDSNGSVPQSIIGTVGDPNGGWFLPGISQQEAIMTQHQNLFSSFRTEFYWSAAPGKRRGLFSAREDSNTARATRYNATTGTYVESGSYDDENAYDPSLGNQSLGGKALRTQPFRIRAAYFPPEGTTIQ